MGEDRANEAVPWVRHRSGSFAFLSRHRHQRSPRARTAEVLPDSAFDASGGVVKAGAELCVTRGGEGGEGGGVRLSGRQLVGEGKISSLADIADDSMMIICCASSNEP